jgi:hypothetical protein
MYLEPVTKPSQVRSGPISDNLVTATDSPVVVSLIPARHLVPVSRSSLRHKTRKKFTWESAEAT